MLKCLFCSGLMCLCLHMCTQNLRNMFDKTSKKRMYGVVFKSWNKLFKKCIALNLYKVSILKSYNLVSVSRHGLRFQWLFWRPCQELQSIFVWISTNDGKFVTFFVKFIVYIKTYNLPLGRSCHLAVLRFILYWASLFD